MFQKNVLYSKDVKINTWRKIALNTWRTPTSPTIYSLVELYPDDVLDYLDRYNAENNCKVTLTHYLGKVCGVLLLTHPLLNSSIVGKKIKTRKHANVFFHVSSKEAGAENLSGRVIPDTGLKELKVIAEELKAAAVKIKSGQDISFNKIKFNMKIIPTFIVRRVIYFLTFLQYRLNLWSPLFGTPQDAFGSLMLTNIGSFGIEEAFVPFVDYTHTFAICAAGTIHKKPVVKNDTVVVGNVINLCWTLDHRILDGLTAGEMLKTLKDLFHSPELLERRSQELRKQFSPDQV